VSATTAVNLLGVAKTALLTRIIVALVLAALAAVVIAALSADGSVERLGSWSDGGFSGTLQAAGLLFFAFAGYARVATLGEEVTDPARTIPRAVTIALGITLVVYATVAATALLAVGPAVLASSPAPLTEAVRAGSLDALAPVVRAGAAVASLGVLLSLLVGVSRTGFAMAARGDLPRWLDAVHPERRVPHRAEVVVAAVVVVVVSVVDLRGAIGFSSFAVLAYYAIANASAWTLEGPAAGRGRAVAGLGLVGCVALALSLPRPSVAGGTVLLVAGAAVWFARHR
jgi:APA family basic amino acid/polyamine antiporter